MSTQLPDSKGSGVELTQPTPEEILHQTRLNSNEWRGALSPDAYLRREEFMSKQALIRDGGLTPWALVTKDSQSRLVLSSCETIRKKALVARDGQVKEVICHGVASVFCPPEYRGKGYGGRMIKDLGEKLQNWQAEGHECLFSVLYSDIGKKFYAARQWHPFPSAHISLSPSKVHRDSSLPEAKSLHDADIAELCALDGELMRKRLSGSVSRGKTVAAIVPDFETLSWHHAKEDFASSELYGKSPEVRGAIVGTEQGKRVWCVWARTWHDSDPQNIKDNALYILRLVVEDAEYSDSSAASDEGAMAASSSYVSAATASLLAAAQAEASKWYIGKIDIWNPTSATLAAARMLDSTVQIVHREESSITSLRWYGETPAQELVWIDNEKYAWC